jgi:hypothetical protein
MLNVPLILISIIDFSGAILHIWPSPGNFMLAIGLMLLAKGLWSIFSSLSQGFYYDFLGLIDLVAGFILIIINFGTPVSFGWIIGIILGLKAVYTLVSSLSLAK